MLSYGYEKNYKQYIEDRLVAPVGWCYPVLDVPRLQLPAGGRCIVAQDVLDLDAPLLPFRNSGSDVPGVAMEAVSGAD